MTVRSTRTPCSSIGMFAGMVLLILAAGCTNPYMKNYISTLENNAGKEPRAILPPSGEPRLLSTENPKADAINLRENGYILLGRSKFRSSPVNEKEALAQARKVGAEVVMVRHKYVSTATESLPFQRYIPGQVVETSEQTIIQDGEKKPKIIDRYTTTVTQGEYHTTYVEQSTDYYDYSATYWAKAKVPVFGAHVKALPEAMKTELGTHKGVLVRLVVKNSPAYDADLLKDDVLISLGNDDIRDPEQFFTLVKKYEGKKTRVLIYRSGQNLTKDILIGKE